MDTFPTCLAIVLKLEGGFVNDPRDPGGMTNLGVTARAWSAWVGHLLSEPEMRALSATDVAPFYRANYWNPVQGDKLPAGLALAVFDFAVNAGPARSAKTLQSILGVVQDGQIGPATLKALQQRVTTDGARIVGAFMNARRAYYCSLPTYGVFGHGWDNRCNAIETAALKAGVS